MKRDLIKFHYISKDVLKKYETEIAKQNLETLVAINFLGSIICIALFVLSFTPLHFLSMRWGFLISAIAFGAVFLMAHFVLYEKLQFVSAFCYVTIIIILWLGIFMGTIWDRNSCAITFIVILIAVPLAVLDYPFRIYFITGVHCVIFCVISSMVKPVDIARTDWVNCAVYFVISILISWQVIAEKVSNLMNQRELRTQRDIDALTKISNRNVCERAVQNYIANTEKNAVLLFMDLDDFKGVNDLYGHQTGDLLLRELGNILKKHFRATDVVSRLGGDEFIVFLPYAEDFDQVIKRVNLLMTSIEEISVGNMPPHTTGVSLGVVCYPKDGKDFASLYRAADAALYDAKRKGKNGYSIYDSSMDRSELKTLSRLSYDQKEQEKSNKKKILLVDDDAINRKLLSKILGDEYDLIEAEDGEQALSIMREEQDDVSVILLDLMMPVLGGMEFIDIFKGRMKMSTPIIVLTQNDEEEVEVRALSHGASDFLTKPYNANLIKHRVSNLIILQENAKKINAIERDGLTGLYKKEVFFEKANRIIQENPGNQYDIVCCDIEKFKVINDVYGTNEGDRILRFMANTLKRSVKKGGICGRLREDIFVFLTPQSEKYAVNFFREQVQRVNEYPINMNMEIDFGIYHVTDRKLPISVMCDNAMIAVSKIKGVYDKFYAYYNDELRNKMLLEQEIRDCMESSLANGDFKVYFQPKYDLVSNEIVGAEALVRWQHPKKGFMPPNEFIPLFEQNGFITKMDQFIWKEVCVILREWIDAGNEPLPVSVNVSRADLYVPEVPQILSSLIEKYDLKEEYLHLEITESAYTENPEQIISVVKDLSKRGFVIEMDDFGTGYSSLSMLNDLPIDILKLDMSFVQNGKKGRQIIGFIVRLAQWMNLKIVAEGVESQEQVEILRSMDCQFVQGYFYAKPMPREGFEDLLNNNKYVYMSPIGGNKIAEVKCPYVHENLNRKTLLIVDDIAVNRAVLVEVFRKEYTVVETDNGQQALDYIKLHATEIEVILLDLIMPIVDGYKVIEVLKKNPNTKNIPIIVTSGAAEDSEERALALGVFDYIAKPYSGSIAKKRVENAIQYTKEMRKMEKYSYPRKG